MSFSISHRWRSNDSAWLKLKKSAFAFAERHGLSGFDEGDVIASIRELEGVLYYDDRDSIKRSWRRIKARILKPHSPDLIFPANDPVFVAYSGKNVK